MSTTVALMLNNKIVENIAYSYGVKKFSAIFSFPKDKTEFMLTAFDDYFNYMPDSDTISLTTDAECTKITIAQTKNNGRSLFFTKTYAIPSDINDINLLCAYLWYVCKDLTDSSNCDKFWFQLGKEHRLLLPWEQERAEEVARRKRIEENSFCCTVEEGYGHAFRSKIYELIVNTYYEALKEEFLSLPRLPESRTEIKKFLTQDVVNELKNRFSYHSLSFSHKDNVLTAKVQLDDHIHKTQVLASSNRKWEQQFVIDAFEFLALTPNIYLQLEVGIYDYEENGSYVLRFGDKIFKGKLRNCDFVEDTDEELNKLLNEINEAL